MPAEFDKQVDAIKKSLRKQYPNWKEDKISSSAYAMATTSWKKSHGGKGPSEVVKDWRLLEFYVPIQESFPQNEDFIIRGVAINETTTLNNVKYVADELQKAAPSFRNVPILLDHKNEVRNIVGRTTERVDFNVQFRRIEFEGKIMDKEIREMIKDGRIGSVSIGAKVQDLIEEEDGSMKAVGIQGLELSLVAVPGDNQANLAQAMLHSMVLKEQAKLNFEENQMTEDGTKLEDVKPLEPSEEEKPEEKPEEKEEVAEEKVQNINVKVDTTEIAEMKKQLVELKGLLTEKKKVIEQADEEEKEDETKGEVSTETEEKLSNIDNRIVEAMGKGNFSMYRDYTRENTDTKLKRLIR